MISNIPNWQTMTAAEIVAYAESHHETARPMNAQELRNYLADNRLAWFGVSGGWRGPLADSVATLAGSGVPQMIALSSGIERLLSHLASPGSVQVDTHLASHGPLMIGMIGALSLSADQIRDLYALGGGRKFPPITLDEAAKAKLVQSARDQMAAILAPVAAKSTAVNAWLDTIDMSQSVAEIEAYIADLLSGDDGNPTQGGE
jgi:hypothetical protein